MFTDPALASATDVIALAVSDTGIGIAERQAAASFSRRSSRRTARPAGKYGGTGLGLSISRDIAQLLGGEIHADSRAGRGQHVHLVRAGPVQRAGRGWRRAVACRGGAAYRQQRAVGDPGVLAEVAASAPASEVDSFSGFSGTDEPVDDLPVLDEVLTGRKILIVDDDVRNIFALTCVLEQHGIEVLYAENGREGIDTLDRNEDVDLVLMDVMMPELDGYATTEAIRRMPQFVDLPDHRPDRQGDER